MKKYIVDRIEGSMVVCEEIEKDSVIGTKDFELAWFERDVTEGEMFKIVKGKPSYLRQEQAKLKKEIDELFDELI